jgi:hypothetical protein
MAPTTLITAFPSVAGPKYIIVVSEPTRPIYLHQSVQTHNEMRAMEIVGIRSGSSCVRYCGEDRGGRYGGRGVRGGARSLGGPVGLEDQVVVVA